MPSLVLSNLVLDHSRICRCKEFDWFLFAKRSMVMLTRYSYVPLARYMLATEFHCLFPDRLRSPRRSTHKCERWRNRSRKRETQEAVELSGGTSLQYRH